MEHFGIIQALCRTALGRPGAASRKRVERLRDALREAGDGESAAIIDGSLRGGRETGAEVEALIRAYKKSIAMRGDAPRQLLDIMRRFATVRGARLDPTRRDLPPADNAIPFKMLSRDENLGFGRGDIEKIIEDEKSITPPRVAKAPRAAAGQMS